jgi:antitoxin YefM
MNTVTASQARAGLYRLIDQTAETHRPVVISGKRKDAMAEPIAKSKKALKW